MSTLQVANVWLESTANNRMQYGGSNNISIYTAGTSRMVIAANGGIGIGSGFTSPVAQLHLHDNSANGYGAIYFGNNAATIGWHVTKEYDNSFNIWQGAFGSGTSRLRIDTTGAVRVGNLYGITVTTPRNVFVDSSGNIGGISSIRASKTNIESLNNADWILDLNPVTFNYRVKDSAGNFTNEPESEKMYGLIAEEVEVVNKDLCAYDENGKLISVYYDRMIAPLIKMVQDQQKTITELQNRLEILEAK